MSTRAEIEVAEQELIAAEGAYNEKRELFVSAEDGFNFALRAYKQKLANMHALATAVLAAKYSDSGVNPEDKGNG